MAIQIRHFLEDHPAVHTLEVIAHDGAVLVSLPAHLWTDTLKRKTGKKDSNLWPIVNQHRRLVGDIDEASMDKLKKYIQGRRSADVFYRWNGQEGPAKVDQTGPTLKVALPKAELPVEQRPASPSE
ncbi:MAG: hypothetical protein WAO58_03305 [Fimbriimonadaceae bacterium]